MDRGYTNKFFDFYRYRDLKMNSTTHSIFQEYTWGNFKDAYLESNTNEYFGKKYPLFKSYFDLNTSSLKEMIRTFINKAVSKEKKTYQDCLDDLLTCVLDGARYAYDGLDDAMDCMEFLYLKGIRFDETKLLKPRHSVDQLSTCCWEDEIFDYPIRGQLLDRFYFLPFIDVYTDWTNVQAQDWEDMYEYPITEEALNAYLNHCSQYLIESFPHSNDKGNPYFKMYKNANKDDEDDEDDDDK